MLLQSWGGVLRMFPAVPAAWKDVAFHDLRAEGAFLVSALRRDGRTTLVRVTSLAGEPAHLRADGLANPKIAGPPGRTPAEPQPDGTWKLTLARGETVVFQARDLPAATHIAPVPRVATAANPFGLP